MPPAASDRMVALRATWDDQLDGRVVFLDCYRRMTDAVIDRVEAGEFTDNDWVVHLLDRFADYYFDSIDGGPLAMRVPEPWVLAHAAAVGHDAGPLQLLLAGVNAHINYDLVLTLVDLLDDVWTDAEPDRRALWKTDYERINLVIAQTADLVQDEVVERHVSWLELADRGLGRLDEHAAVRLLTRWRSRVWRQAVDLLDNPDPSVRADLLAQIERQCARRARWLLL